MGLAEADPPPPKLSKGSLQGLFDHCLDTSFGAIGGADGGAECWDLELTLEESGDHTGGTTLLGLGCIALLAGEQAPPRVLLSFRGGTV